MSALRFVPGQVVVLSTSSLQDQFEEAYLSAFGELSASQEYSLNSGARFLAVFSVSNGEELRFIEYVRVQPGVIAASLNYIGLGLGDRYIDDEAPPELSYQPGVTLTRDFQCLILRDNPFDFGDSDDDDPGEEQGLAIFDANGSHALVSELERRRHLHLIAAIDVSPEHCRRVMRTIAQGVTQGLSNLRPGTARGRESLDHATIIGLTSNIDHSEITDLFGFSDRLLFLAQLATPETADLSVACINMSVDFSQVISGYSTLDAASAESPDTIFSIPFFERILATVVADVSRHDGEETRCPALFAAAGNRMTEGGPIRVRLGYPATRPEVIAATLVRSDAEIPDVVTPLPWVDVPASSSIKPCFAINAEEMAITATDGSSFASAWLAGYYVGQVNPNDDPRCLGSLSKVAWLLTRTERRRLPAGRRRLPCFAALIRDRKSASRLPGEVDGLIEDIGERFHADIALHGSTATVAEWLRLNNRRFEELESWISKDLGDVDFLFSGRIANGSTDDVKVLVRDWFKMRLGRSWITDSKRQVQIHPYEALANATERLRCVTPAHKLYITHGGVIDTWGGLEDLARREISFLPMTHPDFWLRNKYFSSGADCLGLNILHWLSTIVLLQLVSCAAGIPGPTADRNSASLVCEILDSADGEAAAGFLFGGKADDSRERVDRRFDRVEALMGSCGRRNITDASIDAILQRLHQLRKRSRGAASAYGQEVAAEDGAPS